jgi:hypothetical protein
MLKFTKINKNRKAIIITFQIFIIFFVIINVYNNYNDIRPVYDEMYMRKIIYLQAYSIVNNIKVNVRNSFLYLMLNNVNSSSLIEDTIKRIIRSTINFYNNSLIDEEYIIIKLYSIFLKININATVTVSYIAILKIYDVSGYTSLILRVDDVLIFIPR